MKKLIVIKLGGSVVTYKDSPTPKARISIIKRLAKEIKQLSDKQFQIILVHGAGSFAHGLVKKYDLHHGMRNTQQKKIFGQVVENLLRLNGIITHSLNEAGLPVVTLPPHNFVLQSAGKLNYLELGMIKRYLKNNQIPILFGDLVLDDKWGCSVLSGDAIVCYLGKKLASDKVIFLSDVDGIYDSDPNKNPTAKLIPKITNKNLAQVLKGLSPTGRDDVTGEMKGKILQIQKTLRGVIVKLTNGLKTESLLKVLDQDQIGTMLHLH